MTRNYQRFFVVGGILLLALVVRAWGLGEVGLWHDEAMSHYYASMDPTWILRHSAGFINHPPLFFLLLKAWLNTVSRFNQFAVEMLNVFIGTATVGVVIMFARRLFTGWFPYVIAILVAINPYHIYYSGELRMYALATLGVTTAGYFAVKIISDDTNWFVYSSWVIACLLSVYSHSFTAIPIGFMIGFLVYDQWMSGRLVRMLTAAGVFLLLYSPWLWFVIRQATDIASGYWLPDFQWSYLLNLFWLLGGFTGPRTWNYFGLLMAVGVTICFVLPLFLSVLEDEERWVRLLWIMFAGPLIVIVSMSVLGRQSVFMYRPFVTLLPILFLLAGRGLQAMVPRAKVPILVLYVGLLLLGVVQLKAHPPHQYAQRVAEWTANQSTPESVVVHTDRFSFFPSYFYHQRSLDEYLLGAGSGKEFSMDMLTLRKINRERPILLLISKPDRNQIPQGWYKKADFKSQRRWSGREFYLIRLAPSSLKPSSS